MSNLTVTKTYGNGLVLNASDLDNICNSIETFFNVTTLDSGNINADSVASGMTSAAVTSLISATGILNFSSSSTTTNLPLDSTNQAIASLASGTTLIFITGTYTTGASNCIIKFLDSQNNIPLFTLPQNRTENGSSSITTSPICIAFVVNIPSGSSGTLAVTSVQGALSLDYSLTKITLGINS